MSRDVKAHLTTEEFVQFVTDDLSEEIGQALDRHLAQCERCATEVVRFYEAEDAFPQTQWLAQRGAFVDSLRAKVFGRTLDASFDKTERMRSWAARFKQMQAATQAAFATDRRVWAASQSERQTLHDGQSEDGALRWIIVREKNGDLCYMFEAQEPIIFKFRAGAFETEVTLQQKTRTVFFAEITVPGKACPEDPGDFHIEPLC